MHHAEFEDPRVVAVYNEETQWSSDDDFFVSIVEEFIPRLFDDGTRRVLDLGCGTGRLAMGLVARGFQVTGVDPARASLDIARRRPGAEQVAWIEGTSDVLPDEAFVAAVMTSHVSQFFLTDADWKSNLANLHRSLLTDGLLTFDMRDAHAREWDTWTAESLDEVVMSDGSTVVEWTEVTDEGPNTVSFCTHYEFPNGLQLESTATLRFRSEGELRQSLAEAGFVIEHVFGGWERQPVGHSDGELLVVARKL